MIKKIFLLFFFLCSPLLAHAATTDCQQMSSDGKSSCVSAYSYWLDGSVHYQSFDEIVAVEIPKNCASYAPHPCDNKTTSGPPDGLSGYPCNNTATVCS